MRIFCVIPDMGTGGAQRVMSYLVTDFAESHHVILVTWENPVERSFYAMPFAVPRLGLDRLGGRGVSRWWRIVSRPVMLRRAIEEFAPDVVLSFMDTTNVVAIVACLGLPIPVVVSERNDVSKRRTGWIRGLIRNQTYRFAAAIVVQTPRVARYFSARLSGKLRVLPNPAPTPGVQARPDRPAPNGRKRVIGVGRLEPQKGFDRLIEAFGSIASRHPGWDLAIFGEGPRRLELEGIAARAGLEHRVTLPGVVTDIAAELAESHLFAFPSHFEGFPNALAEALSCGLPAIGHTRVSGVEDMIVPGRTGLLIDAAEGVPCLAGAMDRLMRDDAGRAAMGEAGRAHMRQWAPDIVLGAWEDLIEETVADARRGRRPSALARV